MRNFDTGATRNSNENKYAYNGFNSVLVEKSFAEYMHKHRKQADGSLRAPDNWKKGIPIEAYHESLHRHYVDLWELLDTGKKTLIDAEGNEVDKIHLLNAIRFNVNGMLHELLKGSPYISVEDIDWAMRGGLKYDGERL